MKISGRLLTVMVALVLLPALAQQPAGRVVSWGTATPFTQQEAQQEAPKLTKFDLDFPGGTPRELVAAIQKAMERPLNAIVPEDLNYVGIPPLEMKGVDVSLLFRALETSSMKQVTRDESRPGANSFQIYQISYGFRTEGPVSDDSIWSFYIREPPPPPQREEEKSCRFYSLAPYLEGGFSVDDVTTAIQTGWTMLGENSPPTINFHKDTKLLIAVGEPSKLQIIDAVLSTLKVPKAPAPPQPKPGE